MTHSLIRNLLISVTSVTLAHGAGAQEVAQSDWFSITRDSIRSARERGAVTVKFDRFTNVTTVSLDGTQVGSDFKLTAFYSMAGKQPSKPTRVWFMLSKSSQTWEYLHCHNVALLVDGQPISVQASHDGRVRDGYVLEIVAFRLPLDSFLRLATASKVEARVCRTELAIGSLQMAALRDLASRMK